MGHQTTLIPLTRPIRLSKNAIRLSTDAIRLSADSLIAFSNRIRKIRPLQHIEKTKIIRNRLISLLSLKKNEMHVVAILQFFMFYSSFLNTSLGNSASEQKKQSVKYNYPEKHFLILRHPTNFNVHHAYFGAQFAIGANN